MYVSIYKYMLVYVCYAVSGATGTCAEMLKFQNAESRRRRRSPAILAIIF